MRPVALVPLAVLAVAASSPEAAWAGQVAQSSEGRIETRIWLDRGVDPVFQRGDEARVYYRASVDAYMVLFHVNTDGVLRLLFPSSPGQALRARGGRDYRLLFPDSDAWVVDESPGVGYFFVLASEQPFQFERLSQVSVAGGWASSAPLNRIRQDPFVTVDEFKRALLPAPAGSTEDGYAVDFTVYHVGQPYSYPRFLCYQCHTERPFAQWDPYQQTCPDVRVVIYNDPYYYPATRYQGGRVVFPRPPLPGLPQFAFAARRPGELGTPLVRSRMATRTVLPADPFAVGPATRAGNAELMQRVDQPGGPRAANGVGSILVPPGLPSSSLSRDFPASLFPPVIGPSPPAASDADQDRPILRRRSSGGSTPPSR